MGHLRVERFLARSVTAYHSLASGFFAATVPTDEQTRLILDAYEDIYTMALTRLSAWEETWFARQLPAPPARILVCGAGSGREVMPLVTRGYEVDAFEPTAKLATELRRVHGTHGLVVTCSLQEFAAATAAATPITNQTYAAVLLGWGSLTHILDADDRLSVMRAIDRRCPVGPILASFYLRRPESRPERFGQFIGRIMSGRGTPAGRSLMPKIGFVHRFTQDEIELLARAIGRVARWDGDGTGNAYPHVTFVRG